MGMPRTERIVIPAVAGGASTVINCQGWWAKGYALTRDAGAGFTAALEGSVGGTTWANIANLNATGQGAITEIYNFLRVNVTVAGALGATTALLVTGKE